MNVQPITNYSSQKNASFGARPVGQAAELMKNSLNYFYRTERSLAKQERMIKALETIQQIGKTSGSKANDLTFDLRVINGKMAFFASYLPDNDFLKISSGILNNPLKFIEKLAKSLVNSKANTVSMEVTAKERANFIYNAFFG